MITGFDILFFWVARMMMVGIEFMGERKPDDSVPFRLVYIHQLVRDAEKQKMSKTRGNVIDPLAVTEKYGTDAVRFTLAIMAAPGTDIALSEDRMEGYRAFANKIWNAARFLFLSLEKAGITAWKPPADGDCRPVRGANGELSLEDRWIFSRLSQVAATMDRAWNEFRFHEAAHEIYHFFWHEFCDWYLELKKLSFEAGGEKQAVAFENLCRAFDVALRLLHPMMPFITEELWQRLAERQTSIARAAFPAHDAALLDPQAESEVTQLQNLIVDIRNARSHWGVDAGRKVAVRLAATEDILEFVQQHRPVIERLANIAPVLEEATADDVFFEQSGYRIEPPEGVDHAAEKSRLRKQEEKLAREISALKAQLDNQQFLSKASPQIVAERRRRLEEVAAEQVKVQEALQRLS